MTNELNLKDTSKAGDQPAIPTPEKPEETNKKKIPLIREPDKPEPEVKEPPERR
jgi:hypothetical protein